MKTSERVPDEDSDADLLVDDAAVLPAVLVDAKQKKTHRELRADLAFDKADIDSVLSRGDLKVWYPENFSLRVASGPAALRSARDGVVLQNVSSKEWLGAKIARGALDADLPVNDACVKVSRQEAKKALSDNKVTLLPKIRSGHSSYQKGVRAERMILEDLITGVKGKKMVVILDAFMSVAERTLAFLEISRDRGVDSSVQPLAFYYGVEPRDC